MKTEAGEVKITIASDGRPLVEGTGLALQIADADVAKTLGALAAFGIEPPFDEAVRAKLVDVYARSEAHANDLAKQLATLGLT